MMIIELNKNEMNDYREVEQLRDSGHYEQAREMAVVFMGLKNPSAALNRALLALFPELEGSVTV